ncbi:MAG: hypothetical protein KBC96_08275 [Armatimonadetes bacterium]|nr:hypothetical protein [Armatimonadota bacterium]
MIKLRITGIMSGALSAGLVMAAGSLCAAPDAVSILRNMLDSEGRVAFTAHQVTTISKGPSVTSEQIVYRDGFNGMRTEYIAPPALKGEVMADDGRMMAHLVPQQKVLRIRPSRLAVLRQRTEQAAQALSRGQLRAELVGNDRIADQATYVIVVRPRGGDQGPTRKFWVDTNKWVKLKTEDVGPNGAVVSTSYYTRVQFLDSIPESKFRIEAPPGYRVRHDRGVGGLVPVDKARSMIRFRMVEPGYVPAGYKLVGAAVEPFRGSHILGLRYTNNVNSFTLFQTPERTLDRRFIERLHDGPVRPKQGVFSWRQGPLSLTLVGNLPAGEPDKIRNSVK